MPINRKWNLEAILEVAREFPLRSRERLTFEYVLLSGVNDAPENALELVGLLRGIRAKVNLIALNPARRSPSRLQRRRRSRRFRRYWLAREFRLIYGVHAAGHLRRLRAAQANDRVGPATVDRRRSERLETSSSGFCIPLYAHHGGDDHARTTTSGRIPRGNSCHRSI